MQVFIDHAVAHSGECECQAKCNYGQFIAFDAECGWRVGLVGVGKVMVLPEIL